MSGNPGRGEWVSFLGLLFKKYLKNLKKKKNLHTPSGLRSHTCFPGGPWRTECRPQLRGRSQGPWQGWFFLEAPRGTFWLLLASRHCCGPPLSTSKAHSDSSPLSQACLPHRALAATWGHLEDLAALPSRVLLAAGGGTFTVCGCLWVQRSISTGHRGRGAVPRPGRGP